MECQICGWPIGGLNSDAEWETWERAQRICISCRQSFGLSAKPPPAARPPRPCARCGHTVLVRVLLRERVGELSNLSPQALTYARVKESSFWRGKSTNAPDRDRPIGLLDAYVCRACGFVEWYAREPAEIPIGPEYGTELVEVGAPSPYR